MNQDVSDVGGDLNGGLDSAVGVPSAGMPRSAEMPARAWKRRGEFPVSDAEMPALLARLGQETGLTATSLRICLQRGMSNAAEIAAFLNPRLEHLKDPYSIKDMDLAVDRLAAARAAGETVLVFGDYDVDGTTGAALMTWVLRESGFKFDALQPDRFRDGYGLNVAAVDAAGEKGVRVLVTVDCGITSFDAAARAKELGIDLIVVDHHQIDPVKGLPPAHAIVNPQRADCESGLRMLCGCGLAFYLARAMRSRGRDLGWWPVGQEPNLKQHLDLVVMATAADMVPLIGDNHTLTRHGMEVLKFSKKPGVRALLEVAGVGGGANGTGKDLSPSHLGFVIGPRINASGRMASASLALELLTTEDQKRGFELAHELETLNKERAEIQNRIWDEVRAKVDAGLAAGKYVHGIAVGDPAWHEGVVGIVASRVTETYRKPAAVIAIREEENFAKGSVRSYAGKDVLSALRATASELLGFGGHKHAAGLSLKAENLDAFAAAFDTAIGNLEEDEDARPLLIEGEASLEELDLQTILEIERLGPFGPGNPEPVFSIRAAGRDHRVLKGRHLKLNLVGAAGMAKAASFSLREPQGPAPIEAIWFGAAEREELMSAGAWQSMSEWAGVPELNRFRGRVTPTFRVRDWRPIAE